MKYPSRCIIYSKNIPPGRKFCYFFYTKRYPESKDSIVESVVSAATLINVPYFAYSLLSMLLSKIGSDEPIGTTNDEVYWL